MSLGSRQFGSPSAQEPTQQQLKSIFVISPIAKTDEDGIDFTRIFLDQIVKPAAALAQGFSPPVRGDEVKAPGSVTAKVVSDILRADVCVADLTQLNPNVMYEVAIAHAAGKPCILMKRIERDGSFVPPPFDFIDERTIPYGLLADAANQARDTLADYLRNAHHDEADDFLSRTMNPVRMAFQHQRVHVEEQPADQLLLEQLDALRTEVTALARTVYQLATNAGARDAGFAELPQPAPIRVRTARTDFFATMEKVLSYPPTNAEQANQILQSVRDAAITLDLPELLGVVRVAESYLQNPSRERYANVQSSIEAAEMSFARR